ncbi:MAG: hypothetical protein ACOX5A_00710 [Aminivibrio sp.]|jgi:hypothetical protein
MVERENMIEQEFAMEHVLTALTAILTTEDISDLARLASFILERRVSGREIPFVIDEIRRRILLQHPELRSIKVEDPECEDASDWVGRIKEEYGGTILLKAEDFSKKSRFQRLKERTMKLLFKTERLGV